MKTDRFVRVVVVLLACFPFFSGRPAAGQHTVHLRGGSITFKTDSHELAKAVAEATRKVIEKLDESRRILPRAPATGGEPAYLVEDVSGLIARTGEDLDKAFDSVGEPGLEGLSAWANEELANLQARLSAVAPQAVARVASLGNLPLPAAAPQKATVSTGTADQLLDEVKAVLERIFALASADDLEVELWVGSTPAEKASFRFWPQGQIQGSTPTFTIIRTNGKRGRVLRGLYFYRASLAEGSVAALIAYPNSAGASEAGPASERLDLVRGSSFFCCRFDEQHCQHVADEKECRP